MRLQDSQLHFIDGLAGMYLHRGGVNCVVLASAVDQGPVQDVGGDTTGRSLQFGSIG